MQYQANDIAGYSGHDGIDYALRYQYVLASHADTTWQAFNETAVDIILLPPLDQPPYRVNNGRTIPVRWQMTDVAGEFVIDPTVAVTLYNEAGDVVVGPFTLGTNPASGIVIQNEQYHLNLPTRGLPRGNYQLHINGTQSATAVSVTLR